MSQATDYVVRVTHSGPPLAPFGWIIIRQRDSHEMARSEKTFPTRVEALADSARVAASLALEDTTGSDPSSS